MNQSSPKAGPRKEKEQQLPISRWGLNRFCPPTAPCGSLCDSKGNTPVSTVAFGRVENRPHATFHSPHHTLLFLCSLPCSQSLEAGSVTLDYPTQPDQTPCEGKTGLPALWKLELRLTWDFNPFKTHTVKGADHKAYGGTTSGTRSPIRAAPASRTELNASHSPYGTSLDCPAPS